MKEKLKKGLKKKILIGIVSAIISALPIIAVISGGLAVIGFSLAIVDHIADTVDGVKEAIAGKSINESIDIADLSSYDVDAMLDIVDDNKVITEDLLDQMMIERESLKEILTATKEYNETYDTASKKIQAKHIYTVQELAEGEGTIDVYDPVTDTWVKDTAVGGLAKTVPVQKEEFVDMKYDVTAETYESAYHHVNWQSIYVAAVEETLQNAGGRHSIESQAISSATDSTGESSGTTDDNQNGGEHAGGGHSIEDDTSSSSEEASSQQNGSNPNATSLGQFEAGWVPISDYVKKQEKKYHDWIEQYAAMYNLPPDLIRAIITKESTWNPKAQSGAGAKGLCQFTTVGWEEAGINWCGFESEDVWDPEKSIHACARELAYTINYYDGNVIYAFTAYNRGRGAADTLIANGHIKDAGNLEYAAGVLTYFTGRTFTGQQLAAGNYIGGDKVSVSLGYGTVTADGRISLTIEQIDELVFQFEPKFEYSFDVVRDETTYYDYETCQSLPNYGEKSSGDPSTEAGQYIWYEPVSSLSVVQSPYMDVIYDPINIQKNITIRLDRWESILRFYWPHYDGKLFMWLVEYLPKGKEVTSQFSYYASIATDTVKYDGGSISTGVTGWASVATGTYTPLSGVTPSIKIPENCGGMSIPLYLQGDARWHDVPHGSKNIATSGCGATSLAMVISYYTQKCVYPDDIVAIMGNTYMQSAGLSYSAIDIMCKKFGCRAIQQTVDADAIVASLKSGHPVIVTTSGYGTTQTFTKHGHYIVLRGLTDDGKVLVNDPNDNTSYKRHYEKAYDPQFIYSECCANGSPKPMWTIYGPNE